MLSISKCLPGGHGLATVLLKRAATVSLGWETRQQSRFNATDSQGRTLDVSLPVGTVVRGGDVLVAEDGSLVRVQAAPQTVLRITPCSAHGTPFDLVRAAHQLGRHHAAVELTPDFLQIAPDAELAGMLQAMHLTVSTVEAPFEPASGAAARPHGHGPGGDHGHDHGPTPAAAVAAPVPHVHGPHCNHDHAAPTNQPVAVQFHKQRPPG